jgi:ATP-binding cassette subfamily F protein 3
VLSISNLTRSFGAQAVFDRATWFVPDGARIGLVGANGSGKSTLLRMIARLEEPDDGEIVTPKGTTVGYLPQDGLATSGRTVLQEGLEAFADVLVLERQCRELEHALAHTDPNEPGYQDILAQYAGARERWDAEGTYDHEAQAEAVLSGLGFGRNDLHRDAGEFSGGWQMRIALAVLLLRRPNLLLLDEPTNHLDLEARNWLEDFLASYPFTVILVAHDRYFMDVAVQRITEVSGGKLTDYEASFSRYLVLREERREREAAAYREQQEEIARVEAFISRFRYQASKAALVQSRVKYLEKLGRLPPPAEGAATIHFRFPACERSGRVVLRLENATKRYGDLAVYEGLDLTVERGRKVALVGPNGAGKSTLIRMLAGVDAPTDGKRTCGHNVTLGYFAQDQTDVLDPERTVLEEATAAAPFDMVPQVRNLLGAFLFRGATVDKPVRVLSGGERNRLALAILLLQPSNCLLLDEPTNHLDIAAKEVLLEALQRYTGTLVFVAHDRYLLDRLPDEVIEVGRGRAVRYHGNYEDYLRHKTAEANGTAPPPVAEQARERARPGSDADAAARHRDEAKRLARAVARRSRETARLEEEIEAKEGDLASLTALVNRPEFYQTHPNPHSVFSRYAQLKREIDSLYAKLERMERLPAGREARA